MESDGKSETYRAPVVEDFKIYLSPFTLHLSLFTLHFSNPFLSRNASTASLNSFGFSIMMKWPTPSHM